VIRRVCCANALRLLGLSKSLLKPAVDGAGGRRAPLA
jgi:hypothetical protein